MITDIELGNCDVLNDLTMCFGAIGLYETIRYYLENGKRNITKEFLMSTCKDTEKNFNKAWVELVSNGYLIKVPNKNEYNLLVNDNK